jgi:hypothetical protein
MPNFIHKQDTRVSPEKKTKKHNKFFSFLIETVVALSLSGTATAQTRAELGLVVAGGTLLLLTVIATAVVLTVTAGAVSTLGALYLHNEHESKNIVSFRRSQYDLQTPVQFVSVGKYVGLGGTPR